MYVVTVEGGKAHAVPQDWNDGRPNHVPWRTPLPTLCGRTVVALNYCADFADYARVLDHSGRSVCLQCKAKS